VTAFWIIAACVAFVLIAGAARRREGPALADVSVLLFLFGVIAIADMVLGRFVDTGSTSWTLAGLLAFGFALDALYGLMAPARQRRRDQWLRNAMRRRRA
jgi:predicted MFS family arabinose efflux permease